MCITSDVIIKMENATVTLKAGTTVSRIVDFAGASRKRPVDVEPYLIKQYGGKPGGWTHTRGEAKVTLADGSSKKAELHWFESKDVGQTGMKVKRYLKREGKDEG